MAVKFRVEVPHCKGVHISTLLIQTIVSPKLSLILPSLLNLSPLSIHISLVLLVVIQIVDASKGSHG